MLNGERDLNKYTLTMWSLLLVDMIIICFNSDHLGIVKDFFCIVAMHPILSFLEYTCISLSSLSHSRSFEGGQIEIYTYLSGIVFTLLHIFLFHIPQRIIRLNERKKDIIGEGNSVCKWEDGFLPPPLRYGFFHIIFKGVHQLYAGYKTFIGGCTINIFLRGLFSSVSILDLENYSISPYKKIFYVLFGDVMCIEKQV